MSADGRVARDVCWGCLKTCRELGLSFFAPLRGPARTEFQISREYRRSPTLFYPSSLRPAACNLLYSRCRRYPLISLPRRARHPRGQSQHPHCDGPDLHGAGGCPWPHAVCDDHLRVWGKVRVGRVPVGSGGRSKVPVGTVIHKIKSRRASTQEPLAPESARLPVPTFYAGAGGLVQLGILRERSRASLSPYCHGSGLLDEP